MKPEFKIFVKDPNELTSDENNLFLDVSSLVNSRLVEAFRNCSNRFIIYLFFDGTCKSGSFDQLSEKLYYRDNLFEIDGQARFAFSSSLKASLLKRISVPDSVSNLCILISNKEHSEEEFFVLKSSKNVTSKFIAVDPLYKLEDVIMNDDERLALLQALSIIQYKELVFDKWNFKSTDKSTKSILCFHGVPGTGKTMCAHAVAHYLGKKILPGNYNEIQSKFVGEGVQNLKACFQAAEEQDAVLFIDEADTFLSKRLPGSNENSKIYNSMSNELFQFVESFNGCLIFASNHIQDFDPAIISRIIQPIEFKLPDSNARIQMIGKLLPSEAPIVLSDDDLKILSFISEGFSGRDIRKAILLFMASSAYKYKNILQLPDEEITLSFEDICLAFKQVKSEKEKLSLPQKGLNAVATEMLHAQRQNERIIHCAANALWSDDSISEQEKIIFDDLCNKIGVKLNIFDKSSIRKLDDIFYQQKLSKSEKSQLLDITIRMLAVDDDFSDLEEKYLEQFISYIGLRHEMMNVLCGYLKNLIKEHISWESICDGFEKTDADILGELRKEYTEAAAYYQLSKIYSIGSLDYPHVIVDSTKAQDYLRKSAEMGFIKAKAELDKS